MRQRGRKAPVLGVIAPTHERLAAPADMPPEQREIWERLTAAKPADWFGEEHRDMLHSYCRHTAYAEVIGRTLDAVKVEWLSRPENVQEFKTMLKLFEQETKAAAQAATRMRLTHQALDKKIAARKSEAFEPGAKPWHAIPPS